MKTIFQKHTSKFVAGLFNSLGIIACVSLTACGEEKGNQTEKQIETLKSGLLSKYSDLNETDAEVIAEWLEKNKKDISGLNGDTLKEIFKKDTNKLNEVAGKLGVILTESDLKPEDEKQKKINEWLIKLKSLENADFNALDKYLKEKVAQKFIENKIDISNDSVIKTKLAGFIKEVKDEKKQNEISIKVGGDGKVTITTVADQKTADFDFASFEKLQGFVNALDGKYITSEKVELSFAFNGKNVKIGGHGTGFDITKYVANFFKCFEVLIKIEGLNLKVSGLSLTCAGGTLSLNEVDLSSEEYFKGKEFWTLVKDRAAFFGITEGSEFEIEKTGNVGSETVKIEEFVTQLKWSEVVAEEGKAFVEDSGWDTIFKIKEEENKPEEVKVEFKADGKCSMAGTEYDLNSFETLKKFVESVKDKTVKGKTVTVGDNKKVAFSVKDGKTINVKVDELVNFDVNLEKSNFSVLLGYVKDLESVGLVEKEFKFQVKAGTGAIKFGSVDVKDDFLVSKEAWDIIKDKSDLFDLNGGIQVVKTGSDNQYVKIGDLVLAFDVLGTEKNAIDESWSGIFTLVE